MITLSSVIDDASLAVTLVATTDQNTVSFYIQLGSDFEQGIAADVPVVNGIAVYTDVAPPQKVLVRYFAVSSDYERSNPVNLVVPSTYSLTSSCLQGDIRLGDLVLNTIDSDGTVWTVTDIDGYWRLPDAQVPTVDRSATEDGAYEDTGRYLSRIMTLTGVFLPRSESQLVTARQKLVSAFDAVRSTTWLEVDEDPPRGLLVRNNGKTSIDTVRASGLTQFSIQLLAADPIKYAVDQMTQPAPNDGQDFVVYPGTVSTGRAYPRAYTVDSAGTPADQTDDVRVYGAQGSPNTCQIYNAGNYPSPPVIYLWGPTLNPHIEIVETGEYMTFTAQLATGQYLQVNVKDKTVLLNGTVSLRGTMTFDSTWFRLLPGTSTVRYTSQLSSVGSIGATMEAYSAWL